ncbi:hypothetical protein L195_g062962, partial [Trifolium pratense]
DYEQTAQFSGFRGGRGGRNGGYRGRGGRSGGRPNSNSGNTKCQICGKGNHDAKECYYRNSTLVVPPWQRPPAQHSAPPWSHYSAQPW